MALLEPLDFIPSIVANTQVTHIAKASFQETHIIVIGRATHKGEVSKLINTIYYKIFLSKIKNKSNNCTINFPGISTIAMQPYWHKFIFFYYFYVLYMPKLLQ